MNIISDKRVHTTLNRLHKEADSEGFTILKGLSKGVFRPLRPEDMKDAYIALTREQGEYLYDLLLDKQPKSIVEFGTSFGISTLYLGAAAKAYGGKVISTELLSEKCRVAQQNFEEAGLADCIDLREGDALQTLSQSPEQIDFLLMDGWNDLYLPLLKMLEPRLTKGALIYTDNASFPSAKPYLNYLKSRPEKYRSLRLQDAKGGSELTEVLK